MKTNLKPHKVVARSFPQRVRRVVVSKYFIDPILLVETVGVIKIRA